MLEITMADKIVTTNRKARFDYTILESVEAGIQLKGTEVKSLRTGQASLSDSFARLEGHEVFLYNMHIAPYEFGNIANVDAIRPRKLLLHKNQIKRMIGEVTTKKLALIPLKVYFKNGIAKVELALAKGKKIYDKRQAIKERESDRELRRISRSSS
jgi:SsrA-binding protein